MITISKESFTQTPMPEIGESLLDMYTKGVGYSALTPEDRESHPLVQEARVKLQRGEEIISLLGIDEYLKSLPKDPFRGENTIKSYPLFDPFYKSSVDGNSKKELLSCNVANIILVTQQRDSGVVKYNEPYKIVSESLSSSSHYHKTHHIFAILNGERLVYKKLPVLNSFQNTSSDYQWSKLSTLVDDEKDVSNVMSVDSGKSDERIRENQLWVIKHAGNIVAPYKGSEVVFQ